MKIELGRLTQEETEQLLREVIETLPEEASLRVLDNCLSSMQKEELAEWWVIGK